MSNPIITLRIPYPPDTDTERLITLSNVFRGMKYENKNKTLVIYTKANGVLAIPLRHAVEWAEEIIAIAEHWEGVRT